MNTMSKDEVTCKISAVYKHKERKPKKPHYIPRPWGKPYNYKCFQCPFTCMEKSHLYNHMKYSLCKNSLSLLIDSDWPYKKSNILNSDLCLLQNAAEHIRTGKASEAPESSNRNSVAGDTSGKVPDRWNASSASRELSPDVTILEGIDKLAHSLRDREKPTFSIEAEATEKVQESRCSPDTDVQPPPRNKMAKLSKKTETDFIITDVFALKDSVVKNKILPAAGLEAKLKQSKLPKNCVSSNGILMEQWRLFTSGQRRNAADISPPCANANVIPCYPPPTRRDYQEAQGLNLSVLGVNHPMNQNLFSYLNPKIIPNATTPAHLPFLASSAQLIHPHSGHLQAIHLPERLPAPSRFFYPLLFEHTFSSVGSKVTTGREDQLPTNSTPPSILTPRSLDIPDKTHLHKIPTLRPQMSHCSGQLEVSLADTSHKSLLSRDDQEKCSTPSIEKTATSHENTITLKSPTEVSKDSRDIQDVLIHPQLLKGQEACVQISAGVSEPSINFVEHEAQSSVFSLDPNTNSTRSTLPLHPLTVETLKQPNNGLQPCMESFSSHQNAFPQWGTETDEMAKEHHRNSPEFRHLSPAESSLKSNSLCKSRKMSHYFQIAQEKGDSAVLIDDLYKAIHEYQDVEEQLCTVDNEDTPGQKQLRGQLTKIRKELLHIRQALEETNKKSEGPLDLSVKKSLDGFVKSCTSNDASQEAVEKCANQKRSLEEIKLMGNKCKGRKLMVQENCFGDSENTSLDLCIKIHNFERLKTSSNINTSTVSKANLTEPSSPQLLRSVSAERTFISRTTKCEADSSVPLRSLSSNRQNEGEKLCTLNPLVAETLGLVKQSRII
ncbi:uncharacterized protein prr35 [Stegostoma tigrinum]|uniref:uncharacterized protein prr35 n=1 Tax=Stegostoma tigrinum TaxID=3053191 RepID=UPI00202B4C0F|nr:uncharacterized protein prr35 [Stegostoma tigrinum]